MKKLLSITFSLFILISSASYAVQEPKLDSKPQKLVVERVKEYCSLMQEFSGDVEKIENMEKIYEMCENSNVSVFNDLASSSTRDISDNSMPLQQYMMMLTDKFENNVKTSYSGYKYIKMVVQPSPLKEFNAATYAFVKVDKQVNAPGIKAKLHLNVIVNTATMKVSSTISEDYEDPQRIYLEALEKYNEGDYSQAIPLFEKVSVLPRFSGRYRAKSMLGWIYAEQKEYQKAYDLLKESSAADPLGGIILASKILMRDDVPVNYINNTEGVKILRELSNARDKEIPIMHLIAASALVDASMNLQTFTGKIELTDEEEKHLGEILLSDPNSTGAFKMIGYWQMASIGINTEDVSQLQECLANAQKAEELLHTSNLDKADFERWDVQISMVKMGLLQKLGDSDGLSRVVQSMVLEKPYAAGTIARLFLSAKQFGEALEWFKRATDYGDGFANYIVSLSCSPLLKLVGNKEFSEKYFEDLRRRGITGLDKGIWWEFVKYLYTEESFERSAEEYLKWNQKAIDIGDVYAMEDRAFFEIVGDVPGLERNIPHATTLSCVAACVGLRKLSHFLSSTHYTALQIEVPNKSSYEETETVKTLKELDEQGNGAASYLLYQDYMYLNVAKDPVKAIYYLERSKDAKYYDGIHEYARYLLLEQEKLDQASSLFKQLIDYPQSGVYGYLGIIEGKRENYSDAMYYFLQGVEKENDYLCYEGLSILYRHGDGCKKDLSRSLTLIKAAISYLQLNVDLSENTEEFKRLKDEETELERLLAAEGSTDFAENAMTQLNQVLDIKTSEDGRITLSQNVLSEVFASPKAVVKTVGSNGKTIVSTETAEDFLLRLATLKTDKKIIEVSSKKDKNNKYTELTVQMK
ncbi:MAG: hypothetical protein J6M15_03055 [Prevotella sp.]|nr:hypothetical protein [Prevotella sp.]